MTENSIDVPAVERAVAVAREYDALMGLAYAVLGVGFVMAAATGQPAVWIALGAAFSAISVGWYHRRFGFARPRRERLVRANLGAAAVVVVLLVAFALDRWLAPPVVLSLLAVAAGLGVGQFLMLRRVGLTAAHWAVYAAVVLAAFAPVLGVTNEGLFTPYVLAVAGAALFVVGLVDHRRLVAAVGPAAGDGEHQG